MANILVLGGGGYISSKLKKYWKSEDNLIFLRLSDTNYLDKKTLEDEINKVNAKYIINCYGYTGKPNVDSCENNAEECHKRNVIDNFYIHKNSTVPVITISSGCIYNNDSQDDMIFTEESPHNFGFSNPLASTYSRCKSEFELLISDDASSNLDYILRIRMPFDDDLDDPKNYVGKILKYDKKVNYKNSITHLEDLCRFIELIVRKDRPVPPGIYNVVNENGITAREILDIHSQFYPELKKESQTFNTTDDLLSIGMMKCRRSNCVLSTDKIKKYYEVPTSKERITELFKK
jgi:dTDP-4-dehydrorhamnose reductase